MGTAIKTPLGLPKIKMDENGISKKWLFKHKNTGFQKNLF
jgi:hypothetical protein